MSLFPSIGTKIALSRIFAIIIEIDGYNCPFKKSLKSRLSLLVNNDIFVFNIIFYEKIRGEIMGSLISGIIAEFLPRPLEDDIFDGPKLDF